MLVMLKENLWFYLSQEKIHDEGVSGRSMTQNAMYVVISSCSNVIYCQWTWSFMLSNIILVDMFLPSQVALGKVNAIYRTRAKSSLARKHIASESSERHSSPAKFHPPTITPESRPFCLLWESYFCFTLYSLRPVCAYLVILTPFARFQIRRCDSSWVTRGQTPVFIDR